MSKLYFRYGCMGSSKTAQALMVKFNYQEKGCRVALMKPSIDQRDGEDVIKSRIGLQDQGFAFDSSYSLLTFDYKKYDVIIVDEAQFLTAKQVDELKYIAINGIPVLCYGLKTDFRTQLFEGSKRLLEIADSISEVKSICKCGRKAEVNARFINGRVTTDGEQILLGANDKYEAMCYTCWQNQIKKNEVSDSK